MTTMSKRTAKYSFDKVLKQKAVIHSLKRATKHQISMQALPYMQKNPEAKVQFPNLAKSSSLLQLRSNSQMSKTKRKLQEAIKNRTSTYMDLPKSHSMFKRVTIDDAKPVEGLKGSEADKIINEVKFEREKAVDEIKELNEQCNNEGTDEAEIFFDAHVQQLFEHRAGFKAKIGAMMIELQNNSRKYN
jgi:hypothetical protein